MKTHNICFHGDIEKDWYFWAEKKNALTEAMSLEYCM